EIVRSFIARFYASRRRRSRMRGHTHADRGTRGVQKRGSRSEGGSARTSIASAFPDSGGCRGLVVGLSGALPSGSAGRAAVQIGALEGTRDPLAPTRVGDPAPAAAAS